MTDRLEKVERELIALKVRIATSISAAGIFGTLIAGWLAVTNWYVIPKVAKGEVDERVGEEQLAQFDLLLSQAKSNSLETERILRRLKEHKDVKILGGSVRITDNNGASEFDVHELSDGSRCEAGFDKGHRGLKNHWISFDPPFEAIPEVITAINIAEVYNDGAIQNNNFVGEPFRLVSGKGEVKKDGFYLSLTTYCRTRVDGAGAIWIAFGH